jgi:hypothetical protein
MQRILGFGLTVAFAAAVATACGEGRAIFNVDVYSFLSGGFDTLHYTVPGTVNDTLQIAPQPVTLLGGLQDSGVDSLSFSGTVNYENTSGGPAAGTIGLQLFFDTAQANVYNGTPVPVPAISGAAGPNVNTTVVPFTFEITGPLQDLFVQPEVFVGFRAIVANPNPLVNVLDGRVRLTALNMRLIVNDQVF